MKGSFSLLKNPCLLAVLILVCRPVSATPPNIQGSYSGTVTEAETNCDIGGLSPPSNDREDYLFTWGFRYFSNDAITGNFEWNKRLGRDNFDEDTINLTIRADF